MQNAKSEKPEQRRRIWRKGERAKVSILQTFRDSYEAGDARRSQFSAPKGETEARNLPRRISLDEATLRRHLQADLSALLNTIELGSAVDLSDVPHVQSSIANYGFTDLSSITLAELSLPKLRQTLRNSLIAHEPRLRRDSIEITVNTPEGDSRQQLSIEVSAELMGDPVDIPVDFDAEVDVSAGKLRMSKLRVQI